MVNENKAAREYSIANYYITMAIDIVLLYVLNNILNYLTHPVDVNTVNGYGEFIKSVVNFLVNFKIPFVTIDFRSCLWAINLALSFGIMGNFVLLLYRPRWFHHLVQVALSALTILAVYIVFRIFPFKFEASVFYTIMRVVLIVIMAGTAIVLISELYRFFVALKDRQPRQPQNNLPLDSPPVDGPPVSGPPPSSPPPDSLPSEPLPPQ